MFTGIRRQNKILVLPHLVFQAVTIFVHMIVGVGALIIGILAIISTTEDGESKVVKVYLKNSWLSRKIS